MLYWLQYYMINDVAWIDNAHTEGFSLNDFCYKPISGEGCIVESPMQYFHDNLDSLSAYKNGDGADSIKVLATCVTPLPGESRACFDAIGTPVLTYAVFGDTQCQNVASECD